MSFFVDSIFSPIEISRQRFTSNPALEVLFCKSTKSMCLKNIYTSTSYILVSWFFLQNIFEKTVFPFYALFGGKIGSYQGRIRAVSEPYQAVSGSNFPFFSKIEIIFSRVDVIIIWRDVGRFLCSICCAQFFSFKTKCHQANPKHICWQSCK